MDGPRQIATKGFSSELSSRSHKPQKKIHPMHCHKNLLLHFCLAWAPIWAIIPGLLAVLLHRLVFLEQLLGHQSLRIYLLSEDFKGFYRAL